MQIQELEEKITKAVELKPGCKYVFVIQDGWWFQQQYATVQAWLQQHDINALVICVNGDTEFSVLEVTP